MPEDSPTTIAVLGAGPIGLEAALYARFLGYRVELYERGRVAEQVLPWAEEVMATPWRLNTSPLGLAALAAQDPAFQAPPGEEFPTGGAWMERYLRPLAASDLLHDSLFEQTEVTAVTRELLPPAAAEEEGSESTESAVDSAASEVESGELASGEPDAVYRLTLRNAAGEERSAEAEYVLDCSGSESRLAIPFPLQRWETSEGIVLAHSAGDFFVLGGKSSAEREDGANSPFPFHLGLAQIRALFRRITDRDTLDLYATFG